MMTTKAMGPAVNSRERRSTSSVSHSSKDIVLNRDEPQFDALLAAPVKKR